MRQSPLVNGLTSQMSSPIIIMFNYILFTCLPSVVIILSRCSIIRQLSRKKSFKKIITIIRLKQERYFDGVKIFICQNFIMHNLPEVVSTYTEHCAACSNQTQTARVYQNADSSPSKDEDLTQCCFNVGPALVAVGQY